MTKKAQYYIRESYIRPVSKKEFFQRREAEIKKSHVPQKHLVDERLISVGKIRAYEKRGILTSLYHKGKKYFPREEVLPLLRGEVETAQRSLFDK